MKICVIVQSFPTSKTIDYIFVEQLCRQFVELGHTVTVIAPQSITKCVIRHIPLIKFKSIVKWDKYSYLLYRPLYLSLGNKGKFLVKNAEKNAINRVLKREKIHPDIFYGHFWNQIYAVFEYAKKYNVPLTGAIGEESINLHKLISEDQKQSLSQYIQKIICVSTKSKEESVKNGLIEESKCIVIPNAIDNKLFYKKDKSLIRKALKLREEDFIISFVGQFNERKGINRLSLALQNLNDDNIKAFFMGTGPLEPKYKNVIFKGTVPHDKLPDFLSCSDLFVLPSTNEGCSNAIIEAMACGLPIISSDLSFNWDILDESNSILVNPTDINEISNSIKYLKENKKLREKMGLASIEKANQLTLPQRANKILNIISTLKK